MEAGGHYIIFMTYPWKLYVNIITQLVGSQTKILGREYRPGEVCGPPSLGGEMSGTL